MIKNKKFNTIIIFLIVFIMFQTIFTCNVIAANDGGKQAKEQLEQYARNIDLNNIKKEDVLKAYDEISENYSNEELSGLLEEYREELKQQGVSEDIIDYGKDIIENTDKGTVRGSIEKDIDYDVLNKNIEDSIESENKVTSLVSEMPTNKKIELVFRLLWANKNFRTVAIFSLIIFIIIFIYETILRWIIYSKAGKHGWAAIVPLYRQIVMYKVCGLSPFLILFWFLPVLGWAIMIVISIVKRFKFAKVFGRGVGFGFGLLFFRLIFESIIAFNSKIRYINK